MERADNLRGGRLRPNSPARNRRKKPEVEIGGPKKNVILVGGYDNIILFIVITLVLFGVVMIFSSSYYITANRSGFDGMFHFTVKQLTAAVLGLVALFVFSSFFNYRRLTGWPVKAGYILSNLLLVYVRLFEDKVNGAYRWIEVPVFGSVQPSEFAKLMVIIMLADYISGSKSRARDLSGLGVCACIIGLPCVLVYWGNNLSTALIIGAIGFSMIFVASPYFYRFLAAAGGAVAALVVYLSTSSGFRGDRFAVWSNPFIDPQGSGYQVIQSLYAVASGGLFGLGLGQSHQKLMFMPEPYNDFIFAVICEELGFFGAAILLLLFAVLIWRGILVAINSTELYGTLLALGATVMIGVQVIINVAVVTNTIPNTGIPMPFISYGGTSVMFILALMGVLLNVSRYRKKG